jgi:serine/threonine protein kinase
MQVTRRARIPTTVAPRQTAADAGVRGGRATTGSVRLRQNVSVEDLEPGSEFAGYHIEGVLGRGGMGVVYRARETALNRPVAIKLLNDASASDPELRHRFEREARLMAALDHPNVIPVYAAGEHDGHLYLVMRYVDGTDLQQQLRTQGKLTAEEAAVIVAQVGSALDAAHARGLVHRDIKPANVLLSGDHVYLTDFGITRLVDEHTRSTDSGQWVGTVDYMSPEHLRGELTDGVSDVYSLGCLLYACLTGEPPFHRETTAATITAQLHDRPVKASFTRGVPKKFDSVIGRALSKRPKDRYQTAGQLGEAALAAARGKRAIRSRAPKPDPAESPTRIEPPTRLTLVASDEEPAEANRTLIAGRRTRVDRRPVRDRTARGSRGRDAGSGARGALFTFGGERRLAPILAAAGAIIAVIIVVIVLIASGGSPAPSGPLKDSEITGVVQQFASAYGSRDARSLKHVLAPQVTRVDTTGSEHGRASVLAEYERQFRDKPIPERYELSDMHVTPGWAGRVSGRYKLTLKGGGSLSGNVTFGVERVDGRPQIGLIATG